MRRRRGIQTLRGALLGLLVLGVVASCSALEVEVPAGASDAPSPPGVPGAPQNNVSDYPVLQRLGKWNGSVFEPVGPGSVRGGTVIAMSHGWSVGYADTYQQLRPPHRNSSRSGTPVSPNLTPTRPLGHALRISLGRCKQRRPMPPC